MNPAPGPNAEAVFFWLIALLCVGGALATISRRNAASAAMCLVGTLFATAVLYVMLYAHFIAIIQVLVYAGAVMVLFVFVVMILNKEEEEPWALRGVIGKGIAGAALVYFSGRLIGLLWRVPSPRGEPPPSFGTTRDIAHELFAGYLFPFEAVSLVLLIAVVGALVVAHPKHEAHRE